MAIGADKNVSRLGAAAFHDQLMANTVPDLVDGNPVTVGKIPDLVLQGRRLRGRGGRIMIEGKDDVLGIDDPAALTESAPPMNARPLLSFPPNTTGEQSFESRPRRPR